MHTAEAKLKGLIGLTQGIVEWVRTRAKAVSHSLNTEHLDQ